MSELEVRHAWVDEIPVIWVDPTEAPSHRKLVIWLTGLSGRKEAIQPQLLELGSHGFLALSFDPWQHGERGTETSEQIIERVFGNFRRYMWPILAHTTEDTPRVIDWAIHQLGVDARVLMGGISMGGDISVAAAGLDDRIAGVAAAIATPDWLRPGMNIPPGTPDADAQAMYDRLNPLTHLSAYARCPAITFECGAQDDHVPPDGAARFREALSTLAPGCAENVRVVLHEGIGHNFTSQMWANCLSWFLQCRNQML